MFINSKKRFVIRLEDSTNVTIPRDFIGDIPKKVANHWMIQAAIKSGDIATPEAHSDKSLEKADKKAKENADAADIRPDAGNENEGSQDTDAVDEGEKDPGAAGDTKSKTSTKKG